MDKRKKGGWSLFTDHVEWWQNYLTEISVLVVGLGLTYWGDAQWDRMEQEVQDGELLQMVAEELDANLTEMEHMEEYYRKEIDFTVWLAELFACYELMEVTTDMGSAYRERRLLQLTHFMERLPGGRHADTSGVVRQR